MVAGNPLDVFKEFLKVEIKTEVRCCMYPDFYESFRTVLFYQHNSLKWNPATKNEVSGQTVRQVF